MTAWRMLMHRTGVLGLCLVPLLFNVALCDELSAASVRESVLTDLEEADPSDPHVLFHAQDVESHWVGIKSAGWLAWRPCPGRSTSSPFFQPIVGSLVSRPPPPCSSVRFTV